MSKKKVAKKAVKKNNFVENKSKSSWIWYVLGAVVLLAVLFFVYKGITGNAIDLNSNTANAFNPIIEMVGGLIKSVYSALDGPLKSLMGDIKPIAGMDEAGMFLAKILLMILVLALTSSILKSTEVTFLRSGWSHWTIAFIVSILSVRFLSAELVATILVPYSTFGVVLSAALPFVLYFFFVEKTLGTPKSPFVRKAAWIFFAVVFLSIWIMRRDAGSLGTGIVSTIYPLTALLSVLMAIFDGTLQRAFTSARMERKKATLKGSAYVKLNDLANECNDEWLKALGRTGGASTYSGRIAGGGMGKTGKDAYDRDIAEIERQMKEL